MGGGSEDGDRLYLDQSAAGKVLDRKGGSGGTVIAETLGVCGVHVAVVVDAVEQHGCFDHVREGPAFSLDQCRKVCDSLADLSIEAVNERALDQAELAGDIERVSCTDRWRIGTYWL